MKKAAFIFLILFSACSEKDIMEPSSKVVPPSLSLDDFQGYKVSPEAKQLGINYWRNLPVMSDLFVGAYQKGVKPLTGPYGNGKYEYSSNTFALSLGDFNNDGWIDIFNGGGACRGKAANLSFLIWNPSNRIFEEKNLINDETNFIGGPVRAISVYLNSDNFVDVVIIGHNDECAQGPNEKCSVLLSDGKGKYNIVQLDLEPQNLFNMFTYCGGDIGDMNGDNLPDLIVAANSHTYIFWGISSYPYFSNRNFAHFSSDVVNYPANNGFGESVPNAAGFVFRAWSVDLNNDDKNDLLLGTGESSTSPNKFLLNLGNGRFNQGSLVNLPVTGISNQERIDYIIDDLNQDGLKDLIALDCVTGEFGAQRWEIITYIQQQNKSFLLDNSWIQYTINSSKRTNSKWSLIYTDFNGDGKKDIGYIDSGVMPSLDPNNDLMKKSVFVRSGNKFIERDFYELDPYAKRVKEIFFR
jgi:hypothetical protein